jgi:simple sugar transport system substrate-binding protein
MHDRRIGTRLGAILGAGVLALTVAAPLAAQDEAITKIGWVSPEQSDLGWNEDGLIAAQAAADSIGAELIDASGALYDDVTPTLNSLKDDGAQFIIAHASGYGATAVAWAEENGIPVLTWEQPGKITPGLVGDAETTNQEGGYLAGVLAATMTQTGELGIVLSASGDPNWQKGAGGFVEGARSVNPDTVFHYVTVSADGYGNESGGNLNTTQVIAAGADIVFGEGNGSSFGMLAAVRDNVP